MPLRRIPEGRMGHQDAGIRWGVDGDIKDGWESRREVYGGGGECITVLVCRRIQRYT